MKFMVSLDDDLYSRINVCADETYMSRSGFISLACTQYINATDGMRLLKDMSLAMRKIADTGIVDEATQSQLEDFERVCKMMSGR